VSRTDRQTDRQTDRITISISRVSSSMLTRDKNVTKFTAYIVHSLKVLTRGSCTKHSRMSVASFDKQIRDTPCHKTHTHTSNLLGYCPSHKLQTKWTVFTDKLSFTWQGVSVWCWRCQEIIRLRNKVGVHPILSCVYVVRRIMATNIM